MKNPDPLMGAKLKSKTHLLNTFFWFFEPFLRVWLQSLKKVLIWPIFFFFLIKKGVKKRRISKQNAKQVLRTRVKVKKVHISVTFLLITFFGAFFQTFFNGFDISVKFCVFLTHIEFLEEKFFFALFSTFLKLLLQMRRKLLKKTENRFLWMSLRI